MGAKGTAQKMQYLATASRKLSLEATHPCLALGDCSLQLFDLLPQFGHL